MKYLLTILLCASPAFGAIAFVPASQTPCPQSTASLGVACTLAAATTAGNDVIVGLSWRTTTSSLKQVIGSGSSNFATFPQHCNGTGACSAIAVCRNCAANTTITPTFSATTKYVLTVGEWSGIPWLGIIQFLNGASSTTLTANLPTADNNNVIVTVFADAGSVTPTAGTGNLRAAGNTGATGVAGAMVDNTAASPGTVTTSAVISAAAVYSASSIELRTTAPKTYVWPDCDATHPCLIHWHSSPAIQASPNTLTTPLYVTNQSSLANNLKVVAIYHTSGNPIVSITDDKSDTWVAGANTTDATNLLQPEFYYKCGGTAGTSKLTVTLTNAIGPSDQFQISYGEASGIDTSPASCNGGTSGANLLSPGAIQPGSITAAGTQMLLTYAVNADSGTEPTSDSGWTQPDDSSFELLDDVWGNVNANVRVVDCTSGCNPTVYAYAQDVAQQGAGHTWNIIAQAFKASNGAGTQPPSGQAWVTKVVQYRDNLRANVAQQHFPTTGNAIVALTSNGTAVADFGHTTAVKNNFDSNLTQISGWVDNTDPQVNSVCLGAGGVNRDRGFFWPIGTFVLASAWYDIAGAKTTGGAQGCVGTTAVHNVFTQTTGTCDHVTPPTAPSAGYFYNFQCDNIVGDLGPSGVFTPTINSGAKSAIFTTSYLGSGPPVGACTTTSTGSATGGRGTACTGNSSTLVLNSMWAAGTSDGQHLYNGDPYAYWYTNSTSPYSVDYIMANYQDTNPTEGGTGYNGGGIEILGAAAAASGCSNSITLMGMGCR